MNRVVTGWVHKEYFNRGIFAVYRQRFIPDDAYYEVKVEIIPSRSGVKKVKKS